MSITVKQFNVFASKKHPNDGSVAIVPAGTAWLNRDGTLSVYLDVLPLDGQLTLREKETAVRAAKVHPDACAYCGETGGHHLNRCARKATP